MTMRRVEYFKNYIDELKKKYRQPLEREPDPVPELLNPNYAYLECSPSVIIHNLVFYER